MRLARWGSVGRTREIFQAFLLVQTEICAESEEFALHMPIIQYFLPEDKIDFSARRNLSKKKKNFEWYENIPYNRATLEVNIFEVLHLFLVTIDILL